MARSEAEQFHVGDAGYAARIFSGGNRLTRWSHRRRSRAAWRIVKGYRFERVVDVGGGDGWFLRGLVDAGVAAGGVVVDIDAELLDSGRASASGHPTIEYVLSGPEALLAMQGTFDLAVCMETLEHVPEPGETLDEVLRLVRPGGHVLVSVPVEVGPVLLGKQLGRWLANRHGGYGYGRYRWSELLRAALLWDVGGLERLNLHSHKGFDFRRVRGMLRDRVTIDRTDWSPIRVVGPVAATTVSWLGRVAR